MNQQSQKVTAPLGSALIALLLHLGIMLVPLGQKVLHVKPVNLTTLAGSWVLALSIFVAMEIHKWTWALREQRTAGQHATWMAHA